MNNNRNNNNRRRGRGNRNQSGNNNQLNRIDSRARGNAPQLLDKYKKLAQDAQHNGDRVQAEYYLQFADHYLRVIADNKARQDEARAKRNEERGPSDSDDSDDGDNRRRGRRPRRDEQSDDQRVESESVAQDDAATSKPVEGSESEPKRRTRKPRSENGNDSRDENRKESRPVRRKPRKSKASDDDNSGEIDASVLPPAIGGDERSHDDGGDNLEQVS